MKLAKRTETVILILSLLLGLGGTCLFADQAGFSEPARTEHAAWWGGLYPEYCLPGAMEAKESPRESAQEAEAQERCVEIQFKYLTFLNFDSRKAGGRNE